MWRRLYLLLVPVRLYFALQASYIHPDEHFQGPEIIAGEVFGWPVHRSWEFTSSNPIRSVLPLWIVYGLPLTTLKWIWEGLGYGEVPPQIAFYALRLVMCLLSFVLEDWAIDELLPDKRQKRVALFFVSSSYVTWTYQSHTFSNSIETLIVLWSIVLIQRIIENQSHTQVTACIALAFLSVLGVFNRITFPAFLVIPAIQLVPHLLRRPKRILTIFLSGLLFLIYAVALDTEFYQGGKINLTTLHRTYILTPWNNLLYNLDSGNLQRHGLHPFWLHFAANLPQLLGPAILFCLVSTRRSTLFWSAITGVGILSCFKHQEARFLIPAVPLLLASIRLPLKARRVWLGSWLIFNVTAGTLFGIYHQGGVIAAQEHLSKRPNVGHVFWWKTYSPPRWLLNGRNNEVMTTDLMGMPFSELVTALSDATYNCSAGQNSTLLVAPHGNKNLQAYSKASASSIMPVWHYRQHIGLDDLDFDDDGVWSTLSHIITGRGLDIWAMTC